MMESKQSKKTTMRIIIKYCFIGISFLLYFSQAAKAQEGNFSMYRYSPFLTNPGQISTTEDVKLMLNYRNQPLDVGENLNSTLVSAYYPVYFNKHKLVIAANIISDQSSNIINTNGGLIGVSYTVPLSEKSDLSLGLQGGFFQRKIGGDFITDGQIEDGSFDPGTSPIDPVLNQQMRYPTVSSGIYYTLKDDMGREKAFIGAALFNMIEPNLSFNDESSEDKLPLSIKTTAGYSVYQNDKISVFPTFRWVNQADNNMIDLGTRLGYNLTGGEEDFKKLILSLWYNSNSIGVMSLAYEQKRIMLGASYDLPLGTGFNMAQNGIFELAVSYKLGKKKQPKKEPKVLSQQEPVVVEENAEPEAKQVEEKVEQQKPEEKELVEKEEPVQEKKEVEKPVEKEEPKIEKSQEVKKVEPLTKKEKETLAKTVRFKLNSDELNSGSKEFLDQVVDILSNKESYNINLIGHTCDLGETTFNSSLGMDRAEIVKEYMVANGIVADRIKTDSKGEKEPIATNNDALGREKNRRVEFNVVY